MSSLAFLKNDVINFYIKFHYWQVGKLDLNEVSLNFESRCPLPQAFPLLVLLFYLLIQREISVETSFLGGYNKYSQKKVVWSKFYELRLKFTHYKNLDLFIY